jgi:type I restriction enzyme S subunit
MSKWPLVPLREASEYRKEFIEIDDFETYKRCRVELHAQGIVLRDSLPGAEIKTKKQQVCRAGEFLVAEIDAKHGGYGIVPDELDGAIVSSHYFLFSIDLKKLDRRFLGYFVRTPAFVEQVAAQGSTNYAAIRPAHVLEYEIPLPPLEQQRRLVARVDALAAMIAEARRLREETTRQVELLHEREAAQIFTPGRWRALPLGDLLIENSRNGLGAKPSDEPPGIPILRISAATSRVDATINESDYKYLNITPQEVETYRLQQGDLVACRFNGNLRFVGRFALYRHYQKVTHVYPDKLIRFRVDRGKVLPEFVRFAMNSPAGREVIESFCATTAGNIGISATELKGVHVPTPSIDEQERIVRHLDNLQQYLSTAASLATETNAELDALLPAILDRAFRREL